MSSVYLGSVSIGQALPQYNANLSAMLGSLTGQISSLGADMASLRADADALAADAASLASESIDAAGLADSIMAQLAGGPAQILQGLNDAIVSIAAGLTLQALQAAIAAGPGIIIESLQNALGEATGRVAAVAGRVVALEARALSLVSRIAEIEARILALTALKFTFDEAAASLASAGVHVFKLGGTVAQCGDDFAASVDSGLPGGTGADPGYGLALITSAAATWTALTSVFKVT